MKKKLTKTMQTVRLLAKYEFTIDDFCINKLKQFKEDCKNLTDRRIQKKCNYKLWDVVIVVFLATLANCDSWDDIKQFASYHYKWLKSFLQMTGGVPSAKSYARIISIINHTELENMLVLFTKSLLNIYIDSGDIICFDGKTDNASSRNINELRVEVKSLNVLNVYSSKNSMCIASEIIKNKTNEITVIPKIIKRINLKGSVATWDALNTQKKNVKAVIDAKGDYTVALKKNQKSFYEDVKLYFSSEEDIIRAKEYGYLKQTEKSHSTLITYEYFQTEDIKWYSEHSKWAGLKSIVMVKKTITKNNKTTVEYRYYISSLGINVSLAAKAIRTHWEIENKLHWHLDYTFNQDKNTTMDKHALFNLQLIKKFSLALLSDSKIVYGSSLKSIRKNLAMNFQNEFPRFFNIISRHSKRF